MTIFNYTLSSERKSNLDFAHPPTHSAIETGSSKGGVWGCAKKLRNFCQPEACFLMKLEYRVKLMSLCV